MRTQVKHAKNVADVSAREALELMKKSLSLYMEMDVKTSIYLEKMYAYKKYCKKGTKVYWPMAIYALMMSVKDKELDGLEEVLNDYEYAGKLLQRLQSETVEDVALSYSQQNLSEDDRAFIELLMLEYSEYGFEFDEAIMRIYEEREQSGGKDCMKITADTTVEEVEKQTKDTFYAMCDDNRGISRAEDVMDNFMERLNNDEFPKDTEPKSDDGFIPTDEMAEKILEGYHEILEDIKKLNLK